MIDHVYSGFLYLLRTSSCSVIWKYEFTEINDSLNPAVAWSHDENYAYMLAYDKNEQEINSEMLIVMKDPYLRQTSDSNYGDPDVWKFCSHILSDKT